MNKKYIPVIISFIFLILTVSGGLIFYVQKKTHKDITFTFSNIKDLNIYSITETTGDGDNKLIATISKSGDAVSLRNFDEYIVKFDAKDGYEDGEKIININQNSNNFNFTPYYSDTNLENLITELDIDEIYSVFSSTYPQDHQYVLNPGKLYGDGSWYGTTLTYTGNDNFHDDKLLAIFHKENDAWVLKTTPPDITLSKYIYPDIPEDILRKVNKLSAEL